MLRSDCGNRPCRAAGESLQLDGERHQIAAFQLCQLIGDTDFFQDPDAAGEKGFMAGPPSAFIPAAHAQRVNTNALDPLGFQPLRTFSGEIGPVVRVLFATRI